MQKEKPEKFRKLHGNFLQFTVPQEVKPLLECRVRKSVL
jgi:hypothetical protein